MSDPQSSVPRVKRGTEALAARLVRLAAVLVVAGSAAATTFVDEPRAADRLLYPDLGVARLAEVFLVTSGATRELRFTTKIVNVGKGPMEVLAVRMNVHSGFATWQRLRKAGGGWSQVRTPDVKLVYIGSKEHGHWHVRRAARYRLIRLDDGKRVRTGVKVGFCYFDDSVYRGSLPGAPTRPTYPKAGCGTPGDLLIRTGISVGWLDSYFWRIPGQAIDVTGLPAGRYRLSVTADPENWFLETDERNNTTWVEFHYGPATGATAFRFGPQP